LEAAYLITEMIKARAILVNNERTMNMLMHSMAEENGINAITVHGRSVEQGYSGLLDWPRIKEVAQSVSVPVIANGGIGNGFMTSEILQQTGAMAVMPSRAFLGNTWLIGEILAVINSEGAAPSAPEKCPAVKFSINI